MSAAGSIKKNIKKLLDEAKAKVKEAYAEYNRRISEEADFLLDVLMPEDTGRLIHGYKMKMLIFQKLGSEVPYADYVEDAHGWKWTKSTAMDQAAAQIARLLVKMSPGLLRSIFEAKGLKVKSVTITGNI